MYNKLVFEIVISYQEANIVICEEETTKSSFPISGYV